LDTSSSSESLPTKISVIGFGLMGAQITQVLSLSGYEILAFDVNESLLAKGMELIKSGKYGLDASVKKGRITQEEAHNSLSRISTAASMESCLDHAHFVLEVVVEELRTKEKIFKKASILADKDAVLATNTSTLSVSRIGEKLRGKDRERLAGMHFFNPPQIMKLVEVVKTRKTSNQIVSRIQAVVRGLDKIPIVVQDYPGFVANRIGLSVFAEASDLLERRIANIRDIDLSMRLGYGYPMGPFELGDLVGLDARLRNMKTLYSQTKDKRFRPPKILKRLVSEGYLGDPKTKIGSKGGYYEYFGLKRSSEK
jgi:3-hydroxybutyryl-CoA dehydrogenase